MQSMSWPFHLDSKVREAPNFCLNWVVTGMSRYKQEARDYQPGHLFADGHWQIASVILA